MATSTSFLPLALDLPGSRMSLDFTKVANLDYKTSPSAASRRKPVPSRQALQQLGQYQTNALASVDEDVEASTSHLSRQNSSKWRWRKSASGRYDPPARQPYAVSRSLSNASTVSSSSQPSIFSSTVESQSGRNSFSSTYSATTYQDSHAEQRQSHLTSLPLSLLQHILSYALSLPLTVAIDPDQSNRHLQYRYNRPSLDYVDLREILRHPLFLVSRDVRKATLEVFYSKCQFVVDLHSIYHTKVSSTTTENLKKHQRFWASDTPHMVKYALRHLSKLHLRLPAPSTEQNMHRGREENDWMDGSDGKGGGGYRVKSMKKEQGDAAEVHKCLHAIIEQVLAPRRAITQTQKPPLQRSLSNLSTRRKARSSPVNQRRSAAEDEIYAGEDDDGQRQPLKRLEIVFVKRSPDAVILQEALALVRELRTVPVTGYTRYYFELSNQKILWACKRRKRWEGFEPDGARFLLDLQQLSVTPTAFEALRSPTEFKYVGVDKKGQLRLLDSALRKSVIVLERPKDQDAPPVPVLLEHTALLKPLPTVPQHKVPAPPRRRVDSFALIMNEGIEVLGSIGTMTTGRNTPPSIDDIKKIAEQIRVGNL